MITATLSQVNLTDDDFDLDAPSQADLDWWAAETRGDDDDAWELHPTIDDFEPLTDDDVEALSLRARYADGLPIF